MSIEINVPVLPESVADATLVKWYKQPGEAISAGETIVDLETDKVMLEVPAVEAGVLTEIKVQEGTVVTEGQVLGGFTPGAADQISQSPAVAEPTAPVSTPSTRRSDDDFLTPAVRRLVAEHALDASKINGTGKDGRIVKADVLSHITTAAQQSKESSIPTALPGERLSRRVPMTRLRARIAERLLEAQQQAAILTTFNEVDMQPVMDLRAKYRDQFEKTHDVRLGFMAFFVKAAVFALQRFPELNASIDGQDVLYHGYFDIGIAVSSPRGLVVPVIRNADQLTMAEIEQQIVAYATKAKEGKLTLEEMSGGTFTITNGGVFGSMLSTPILNPPQSAILGMHNIVKRAVVIDDQIVIRPMMYLALSYDHRLIDGKQSVQSLVAMKSCLEDPTRLLLGV